MKPRRVLVCGGRAYDDYDRVAAELKTLMPILEVMHGGASGADSLAGLWAQVQGITVRVFHADWGLRGRSAGVIRNRRMLVEGKPDLVLAFPGGRGTADMVRRAKKAGVEVREVK